MTDVESWFQPGERIAHHEYGQGVVLAPARDGYLRAFFGMGERRVPVGAVRPELGRAEDKFAQNHRSVKYPGRSTCRVVGCWRVVEPAQQAFRDAASLRR